jgi:nicotinamide mononucleotide transporter
VLGRGRRRFAHLRLAVCTRAIADAIAAAGLYVGVAVFGFLRWSHEGTTRISLLSWRGHAAGIAASLLLAVAIARFLAAETQAAWPHLDASTMVLSLFATWLTARGRLENWLYWIVLDAVQAWLYAAQGLVFTAFLFLVYLVIGQ